MQGGRKTGKKRGVDGNMDVGGKGGRERKIGMETERWRDGKKRGGAADQVCPLPGVRGAGLQSGGGICPQKRKSWREGWRRRMDQEKR